MNGERIPMGPLQEQIKLGTQLLEANRKLLAGIQQLAAIVQDNTEAIDSLREEIKEGLDQLGGLKIQLEAGEDEDENGKPPK